MENVQDDVINKVGEYESFVNEKLKTDLKKLHDERSKLCTQQSELYSLQRLIDVSLSDQQAQKRPLKCMVDLGVNIYSQAVIDTRETLLLSIGFGFFLELTLPEASKVVEQRIKQLDCQLDTLAKQSSQVKAYIKLMMGTLMELQQL